MAGPNSLVLLIPDDNEVLLLDARISAWVDAAQEEGFALSIMTDAEFVALGSKRQDIPGIILPDHTHQVISDTLLITIKKYVSAGGKLMLTYDAGTFTEGKFYSIPKSRLSQLVGVDYALHKAMQDKMLATDIVVGTEEVLWQLQIPPGKSMPYLDPPGGVLMDLFSLRAISINDAAKKNASTTVFNKQQNHPSNDLHVVTGYSYGRLDYPSFITRGKYMGEVLLASPSNGLVAGVNAFGSGKVLFVNLPLSRLKGDTDGVFMHGFINYFATDLAQLPRLATHPKAVGGMVLNWHLDSAGALAAMEKLDALKIWDSGPYSIHITAGPDTDSFGDKTGLNVTKSKITQKWINYFLEKGHALGSHGGWIHNYFATNASDDNQAEIQPLLELNKSALEQVSAQPIFEYSAPSGNNPQWSIDWLEKNGFLAYYFVGHAGLSVTRNYRDGQLRNPGLWAFPVTTYGKYATIEEFFVNKISAAEVSQWLSKLIEFNWRNQSSRLIYFHPPGAMLYPAVTAGFIEKTNHYINQGRFAWYTMSDLASFQARRLKVTWTVKKHLNGSSQFEAKHPDDMSDMTWILPATIYGRPKIVQGDARVLADNDKWLVIVNTGKNLLFIAEYLND